MKGCLLKVYQYDPTDSGRRALSFGLVCPASLFFTYIALLSSTCDDDAIERKLSQELLLRVLQQPADSTASPQAIDEPGDFFRIELQLSGVCLLKGLDWSCRFVPGVCLPTGLVCSC